jgi:hypothetical protein
MPKKLRKRKIKSLKKKLSHPRKILLNLKKLRNQMLIRLIKRKDQDKESQRRTRRNQYL